MEGVILFLKRKVLSLLLSVSMLLSLIAPVAAATENPYAQLNITVDSNVVTVAASEHGIWEVDESVSISSTNFNWSKEGFVTFPNYAADIISKANASGSEKLILEGCKDSGSADQVKGWVEKAIRLKICAHAHTAAIGEGKEPVPCKETGITPGLQCSDCNYVIYPQQVIPIIHASPVHTEGKPATCTSSGYTAGESCSACGKVLSVSGSVIPALGHSWTDQDICRNCGRSRAPGAEIPTYLISINDSASSTTTADAHYACAGTLITLTTKIAEGATLVSVKVTDTSGKELAVTEHEDGTHTFTIMESNVTVTVRSGVEHKVNVAQNIEHGVLSVDCENAAPGRVVTVTASPDSGYTVDTLVVSTINGPVNVISSEKNIYTFEMPDTNVTISATFAVPARTYQVFTAAAEHGTVRPKVLKGTEGTAVKVEIIPDEGYKVGTIEVLDSTDNKISDFPNAKSEISFTMPASDVTIKVTFVAEIFTISEGNIGEHGSVNINPTEAQTGASIVITATPEKGYVLSSIYAQSSGEGSFYASANESPLEFKMPACNVEVHAEFEPLPPEYIVAIAENDNGTAELTYEDSREGSTISVDVVPSEGYQLDTIHAFMTEAPAIVVPVYGPNEAGAYTFTMPDGDVSVEVTFKPVFYNISVANSENGTIKTRNGIKAAAMGNTVVVEATPNNGYEAAQLMGLYDGADTEVQLGVFENNICTFVMPPHACQLRAVFTELPPEYIISVNAPSNGTVSVVPESGSATAGDNITVTADPDDGYSLSKITITSADGSTEIAASAISPCTFQMPEQDVKVSVEFTKNLVNHDLTLTSPENGKVEAASKDTKAGSTITIKTVPNKGYEIDTIRVTGTESGENIVCEAIDENGEFTFVMPDCDTTVTVTFKPIQYTITAGSGITLDHDTAERGDAIVITVTPDNGYTLSKLIVTGPDGELETTSMSSNQFCFIMPYGNVTVSAQFAHEAIDYQVEIIEPVNGTVTANPATCKAGTLVTITTKGEDGYALDTITIRATNGTAVALTEVSNGQFTFVMPESNVELTATFKAGVHQITPNVIGKGSIRISSTSAVKGQTIEVTVTPENNYAVNDFSVTKADGDNIVFTRSGNTYRFTMPANSVTVTVRFKQVADPLYTISVKPSANGTVQVTPISAKTGATVTVNTTPANGYTLEQLAVRTVSGLVITPNLSNTGNHTFIMPAENVTVAATFKRTANSIIINDTAHGKISTTVDEAEPGQNVSILTYPDVDYMVKTVTVTDTTGKSISVGHPAEDTFSFTMPDNAVTVFAEFVAVPHYTISLSSMNHGSATLSTTEAKEGAQVSVTPKADTGYQVDSITVYATANGATVETVGSNGVYSFTMPASNVSISVTFKEVEKPKPDYPITIKTPVNGFVQTSSSMAKAGATVTITVQPKSGYVVDTVSVIANDEPIMTQNTAADAYTFIMPESNVVIDVAFKVIAKPITVSDSDNGTIHVDIEAAVPGSRVTITGTPKAGYELKNVIVTGANGAAIPVIKTTNGQYSFTMPEQGVTVKGMFEAIPIPSVSYDITIGNIEHGVAKTSHSTAKAGTTITVTSKPAAGYEFASMTIKKADGTTITGTSLSNGSFSFKMPESNVTISVTFKALAYNVKTTNSPNGTVRVDLPRAACGDKVTVTPVPNAGYDVETISVKTTAGKTISVSAENDGTYMFVMPSEEVTVSAQFKQVTSKSYTVAIAKTEHGKVEALYENSIEGSKVTIKTTPSEGYELSNIKVNTQAGNTVKVTPSSENGVYTFTMPASDVTINATFTKTTKPTSSITIVSSVHGTTDLSSTSAAEGTRVTITTKPDANYTVDTVAVKDAAGKNITVSKESVNSYSFTMPANDVDVSVTYKSVTAPTGSYSIIVQSASYGVVAVSPERAEAGTPITLNVYANNGYRLDRLTVKDSRRMPVPINAKLNGAFVFIMPSSNVTVLSTFVPTSAPVTPVMYKTVKLNVSGLGKAESSCEQASPGTTVTVTAKPDVGFYLGTMRVTDTTGHSIKLTKKDNETFQFILPTSNVTVYVSFYQLSSNNTVPIMPGTNVDPNEPTNPSNPVNPSFPTLPDSPFAPINSYQLPFSDMGMTSWFYKDVLYLYQRGIVKGISATGFGPSLSTTRGEVATMLYRLAGEPTVIGTSPFVDVAPLTYYTNAISWAAANGYVNGYSSNIFAPGDKISREQLVTILYRYVTAHNSGIGVGDITVFRAFGDSDAVSDYAVNAMVWACNTGIIKGDSDNMLKPGSSATRAEISAILHRFCEQYLISA